MFVLFLVDLKFTSIILALVFLLSTPKPKKFALGNLGIKKDTSSGVPLAWISSLQFSKYDLKALSNYDLAESFGLVMGYKCYLNMFRR